jgi:hypothetical protein
MEWVEKALDTVVGANLIRQDLSATITLADGRPRPILQNAPQNQATGGVHYWDEQGLIGVGAGAASYAEGDEPAADAQAATRPSNKVCLIGKTASVTDLMIASFMANGRLADGVLEAKVQGAIDYQIELKTREVLDEMEWMHLQGDSSVTYGDSTFPGGQTDGLYKWATGTGSNVYTPSGASATTPVAFDENFIRHTMRTIALGFPAYMPDTMLIPPELKPDVNTFTGAGAGNPIVRILPNDAAVTNFVAGSPEVSHYDTGFGVVAVRVEPNLSPVFNPSLSGNAYQNVILYNSKAVVHSVLEPLQTERLARVKKSVQTMVTTTFCQEHRVVKHTGVIKFLKSSIA